MESELNDYVNVYVKLVSEYIADISEISSKSNVVSIGYRAITNVFQLNYIHSKSLIASYNSCKQATAFYSEYIEQMNRNNNGNLNDAVIFLYNKLIIDNSKVTNISEYPISKISKVVDTILWWHNPNIRQLAIPQSTIINFACLFRIDCLISYLEIAQQREMSAIEYSEFLAETYNIMKKQPVLPENDVWIVNYGYKRNKWDDNVYMPIKKWCKWLLINI